MGALRWRDGDATGERKWLALVDSAWAVSVAVEPSLRAKGERLFNLAADEGDAQGQCACGYWLHGLVLARDEVAFLPGRGLEVAKDAAAAARCCELAGDRCKGQVNYGFCPGRDFGVALPQWQGPSGGGAGFRNVG
jgi:hypothetical protein